MSEQLFPLIEQPGPSRRVDTTRKVNPDGTVSIGDSTYVPETVGTGIQGYDPGAKGEFSTTGNKRVGDGDDGFDWQAGWLGTSDRQTELLQGGGVTKATKNLNWWDRNVLKINEKTLRSASNSSQRDTLGDQFNGRLKAVGAAPVGWGESVEEVKARLLEKSTRTARAKTAKQTNTATESNFKSAGISKNEGAAKDDLATTLAVSNANFLRQQQELAAQERQLSRADSKEAKSMEYRLLQDKMDREDWRFKEEMKRYDKNKRTETIQGLVGGLAALGAAFAI